MDNQELIRKVFELVKQELLRVYGDDMVECVKASGYVPEHCGDCFEQEVSTREVIGIIEITKENNSQIIDATNRQNFVENKEYSDLKDFIIEQLNVFAEVKKYERVKRKKQDRPNNQYTRQQQYIVS